MGLPSLLIALATVTIGLLYTAWAIHHTHTNAEPRIVSIIVEPPRADRTTINGIRLPRPSRATARLTDDLDARTEVMDVPLALRLPIADGGLSRGEWQ